MTRRRKRGGTSGGIKRQRLSAVIAVTATAVAAETIPAAESLLRPRSPLRGQSPLPSPIADDLFATLLARAVARAPRGPVDGRGGGPGRRCFVPSEPPPQASRSRSAPPPAVPPADVDLTRLFELERGRLYGGAATEGGDEGEEEVANCEDELGPEDLGVEKEVGEQDENHGEHPRDDWAALQVLKMTRASQLRPIPLPGELTHADPAEIVSEDSLLYDQEIMRYVVEVDGDGDQIIQQQHFVTMEEFTALLERSAGNPYNTRRASGKLRSSNDGEDRGRADLGDRRAGRCRTTAAESALNATNERERRSVRVRAYAPERSAPDSSDGVVHEALPPLYGAVATPGSPVITWSAHSSDPGALQCLLCGAEFTSRPAARRHIRAVHVREIQTVAAAEKVTAGAETAEAEDESCASLPFSSDSNGSLKKAEVAQLDALVKLL